jgi:2'-5' RNA ligase
MGETRRVFFALWPPDTVRQQVAAQTKTIIPDNARPVTSANLHITLAFLGPVEKEKLPDYQKAAAAVRASKLKITLDQVGSFARAQVLWLGTSKQSAPLQALVSALNKELQGCGYQADNRPFVAHVTLARKYRQKQVVSKPIAIDWLVDDFSLVESCSTPGGVKYHVLQTWPLLS